MFLAEAYVRNEKSKSTEELLGETVVFLQPQKRENYQQWDQQIDINLP